MTRLKIGFAASFFFFCGAIAMSTANPNRQPLGPDIQNAEEVAKLWSPDLEAATEYSQLGGSPKQSKNVAAYSFKVVGPSFEDLWNHYAQLCGVKQRYGEKNFLITADAGPYGSFVVADQATADGQWGRGLSVFLLKTDRYTVTVTFKPDQDGKSISGSLAAVIP